jgi:PAS domain S-box-containing protein
MTPNTRVAGEEPGMLIQRFDWAGTSVGERSAWSHSLRVSVDSMLTSAMPMLLMWGPQHVVFYNSACAAILGDRHPGAMGGTAQIIWPEFWDRFVPLLQAANDGRPQTVRDAHFMLDSKNPAKEIWLDLFYAPVADEHGKTGGVMCAMIDTTDRIRSQQESERFAAALREANHTLEAERQSVMAANRRLANESGFLRELFQQAPGFVAVLRGPEHVFEVANPSYQRLLGNRELIGKPVRESVPEAVSHGLVQVLDQVYSSGEPFVGKNIKVALQITPGKPFEQRILDFVYQPIKNAAGAVEGIFVEGMDMTEQMINIDRLRVAQQAGGVGTFEWFPERDEIVISDEYRRIWGFPPDLAVSPKTIVDTVDPRDRRAVGPALWRQQDNPLAYAEYRITRHSDGQQRWIARRGEVIQQEAPLGPRYVGAVTDITERKRVEDELRASIAERRAAEERLQELNETLEQRVEREVAARGKAEETLRYMQKMDAIGQLTGGVAHDFNNVLQIISANLQLLQPNLEREQVAQRRIDTAITAVERGARLSSHLLAFARRQPLRPEVLNLQRRLGEMEELWQRALGVTVVVETEVADGLWIRWSILTSLKPCC